MTKRKYSEISKKELKNISDLSNDDIDFFIEYFKDETEDYLKNFPKNPSIEDIEYLIGLAHTNPEYIYSIRRYLGSDKKLIKIIQDYYKFFRSDKKTLQIIKDYLRLKNNSS